jgi:hypothetical protein
MLESALGTLHHKRQNSVHPLLSHRNDMSDDEANDFETITRDVAGLRLEKRDGMDHFFGNVQVPRGVPASSGSGELAQLPLILVQCTRLFPFPTPPGTGEQATALLRQFLPDRGYTEQILHGAFEDCIYLMPAVEKTLIFVELLPGLYDPGLALPPSPLMHQDQGDSPRAFALLYALLALGVLLDVDDPARVMHAEFFSKLCLAGLGAVSVLERPTYFSVLSLHFHATYIMRCQTGLGDVSRCFLDLAYQTAKQVRYLAQDLAQSLMRAGHRWDYVGVH